MKFFRHRTQDILKFEKEDILKINELEIIAESKEAGIFIVMSKSGRQIFVTGHAEYDPTTSSG